MYNAIDAYTEEEYVLLEILVVYNLYVLNFH